MSRQRLRVTATFTLESGEQIGQIVRVKADSQLSGQIPRSARLVEITQGDAIEAIVTQGNWLYMNAATGLPGFQITEEGFMPLATVGDEGYLLPEPIDLLALPGGRQISANEVWNATQLATVGRPTRVTATL